MVQISHDFVMTDKKVTFMLKNLTFASVRFHATLTHDIAFSVLNSLTRVWQLQKTKTSITKHVIKSLAKGQMYDVQATYIKKGKMYQT